MNIKIALAGENTEKCFESKVATVDLPAAGAPPIKITFLVFSILRLYHTSNIPSYPVLKLSL